MSEAASTTTDTAQRPGPPLAARLLLILPVAAIGAMALWVLIVILGGGRLLVIETPSMGTAAPAGTLVVSYPAEVEQLRVGDVISFQPSDTSPVYTHRIQEITEQGTVRTRGDLNEAADGWELTPEQIVGKAEGLHRGFGFVLHMAPWIVGGFALTALLRRLAKPQHRTNWWLIGASASLALACWIVRPLFGAVSTGFVPINAEGEAG